MNATPADSYEKVIAEMPGADAVIRERDCTDKAARKFYAKGWNECRAEAIRLSRLHGGGEGAVSRLRMIADASRHYHGPDDDPLLGYIGSGASDTHLFRCESCGSEDADCTKIPHASDCAFVDLQNAMREAETFLATPPKPEQGETPNYFDVQKHCTEIGIDYNKACELARRLKASTPPAAPAARNGWVLVPKYIIDFLLGQGALEGYWFGDKPATERGQFWWRSRIRDLLTAAPQPEAQERPASGERLSMSMFATRADYEAALAQQPHGGRDGKEGGRG